MERNITAICGKINELAQKHPFGKLQEIRKKALDLSRMKTRKIFSEQTIFEEEKYAFHSGGRRELQFNIGFEGKLLRYGFAFSFEPSFSLPNPNILYSQVLKLNALISENPAFFGQFEMWEYKYGERSENHPVRQITADDLTSHSFVFIGRLKKEWTFEHILETFDDLLEIYIEVINKNELPIRSFIPKEDFKFKKRKYQLPETRHISVIEREVSIKIRHSEMQEKLYKILSDEYGEDNVSYENRQGKNRIDIVVNAYGHNYFYEVKTASSARACIREGFGQLMEYAYYPDKNRAEKLIIVGEYKLDSDTEKYLQYLNTHFSLRLSYLQVKM
ncbi:MAG: hypothetical protein IJ158_00275 [Treponema sp.]|nr:hypothetical protein [Treponema sp.]